MVCEPLFSNSQEGHKFNTDFGHIKENLDKTVYNIRKDFSANCLLHCLVTYLFSIQRSNIQGFWHS